MNSGDFTVDCVKKKCSEHVNINIVSEWWQVGQID